MITPVNGHLLIEPLKHESFVSQQKETYEEIGKVVDYDMALEGLVQKGYKVYFDSWLAAKYPQEDDTFVWLVKWEDVRALDYAKN